MNKNYSSKQIWTASGQAPIQVLHCGSHGGSYRDWCAGRSPDPIEARIEPVYGPITVFNLCRAAYVAGLVPKPESQSDKKIADRFLDHWLPKSEEFWGELERRGITCASIDKRAAELSGCIIGWVLNERIVDVNFRYCDDLVTTLAVLSRRVGNFFVSSRKPIYDLNAYPMEFFCVDDPRFVAKTMN